jgi:hypothetical protein
MKLIITKYKTVDRTIIIERADWYNDKGEHIKEADLSKATHLELLPIAFAPNLINSDQVQAVSDRLGMVFDPVESKFD